jgi:hypothetical protein
MVGCLVDLLIDWLVGWLIAYLVALVACLVGWLIDSGWLLDIALLVGWLVGWLLVGCLVVGQERFRIQSWAGEIGGSVALLFFGWSVCVVDWLVGWSVD